MNPSTPRVSARLMNEPDGPVWAVIDCPYCGQGHRHSAGEDPRDILGEVPAPCGQGQYILVETQILTASAGGSTGGGSGGDGNEPNIIIDEPGGK